MRLHSFLLICLSFLSINILVAQSDQVTNHADHHNHDKCGFIHATKSMVKANPEYAKQLDDYMQKGLPMMSSSANTKSFAPTITIPVVVHIIHNGEAIGVGANIADGQIQGQIAVMNEDFAALNANYNNTPSQWQGVIGNPEIQFCLANVDPAGNPTNGITRNNIAVTGTGPNDHNIESIKPQVNWDPNNYYNIFVVGIPGTGFNGGVLGYAYLPFNGTIGADNDGAVCDYRWFGAPGWPNSGDKTMTHETGHYLGLSHVWQDVWGNGGCSGDDGISDTPMVEMPTSQVNPNFNCFAGFPTGPVSCGNEHMYVNYMDYVNDEGCYTSFTQGQVNVMRGVMEGTAPSFGSRLQLANNSSTACTNIVTNDAGITTVINPIGQQCGAGSIIPQVTLGNFGVNALTSATISYTIDGGTPTTFNWTGNLAQSTTINVTLPAFNPPAGVYTFNAFTSNPNGGADQDTSNDATAINASLIAATNIPLLDNFETASWNPTAQGLFPFNVSNDAFEWELTTAVSAYGNGSNAAIFDNYDGDNTNNPFNTVDALITPTYDFSNVTGANLTFDYAYSGYNDGTQYLGDSLWILISTDCGTTFSQRIYENGGLTLETAPAGTAKFIPTATQWGTETISLAAFDNTSTLTISFLNWSGWGNQMFLDNISINNTTTCTLVTDVTGTDVLCNGVCNGTATAVNSNEVGAVTYAWSANAGSQTTATATNLCAGSYTVTITDGANCSETETITITQPTTALTASATGTNETAVGASDGTATSTPSGGTGPYNYAWSNGMTTQTISGLTANTYTVVVTDNNNCTTNASYIVLPFNCPAINASVTPIAVTCAGAVDGSATAVVSGGATPHTYVWSNGQTVATATGLAAGNHSVVITDSNQCTVSLNTTITAPTAVTATASATNETGVGANNGTATVVGAGGTPAYTYAWSNGMTTASIMNLAPGTYSVVATDMNNCNSTTQTVVVEAFVCPLLNLSVTGTDVSCNGEADGTATASFEGGSAPWTYSWSNGMTAQTITGLIGGTYTVTLTDGSSCSETVSITLSESSAINLTASATDETANGSSDGTAIASVTGGASPYTYSWNTGATTASISNLIAGLYNVVITDANNCTATTSVTVNGFSCAGVGATLTTNNISCFGANDGSINATPTPGTGPYTYAWSNGASTQMISNLGIGTYNVVVTNASNCAVTQSTVISEPMQLVANVMSTNETTANANDGTATVTVQGGTSNYNYSWSNGATSASITGLAPGSYTVDVSDANNCMATAAVTILGGSNPCSSFNTSISTVGASCNGIADGSATVVINGGTTPFNYIWSNGQTTQIATGLAAGAHTVTVTDANNCAVEMAGSVTEPSQIIVTITGTDETAAAANDGTLTAAVAGGTPGYTYLWSNGMTTASITGLAPGNYNVIVTDANNCTMQQTGIVLQGAASCANFSGTMTTVDVSCFGMSDGTAQVVISGGATPFTYQWSNGQTTPIATGLSAGTYDVVVTDGNQCPLNLSTTITAPTALVANITATAETAAAANDGTLTAAVAGGTPGYTYLWSNGMTTASITGLAPGNYNVIVTDANNCTIQQTGIVLQGAASCANFSGTMTTVDVSCFGMSDGTAQVVISGGATPFTYQWSNGQTTPIATGLTAGIYDVVVTDGNQCPLTLSATITAPTALVANITATAETAEGANDGILTVNVSGGIAGYTYNWSNGATTASITNLATGTYTVDVTDSNNCTVSSVGTVTSGNAPCAGFSGTITKTDATCNGFNDGSATANVTGGNTPYTYLWSNGQTGPTASQLAAGTYEVTVSDANVTCTEILTMTVNEPAAIALTVSAVDETTTGANDGILTVSSTGGIAGYTYLWSNNATTATVNNLTPGAYIVTVTDNAGCTTIGVGSILPAQNLCAGFNANVDLGHVSCNGLADGTAEAQIFGGTMPYTIQWSNGQSGMTATGLGVGSHSVVILDANQCPINFNFKISEPLPVFVTVSGTNETAASSSDGTATAAGTGGTSPYSYLWDNGATTPVITNLTVGTYGVTITDANNCSNVQSISINSNALNCVGFDLITNAVAVNCFNGADGSASVTVNGGTSPHTYMWSNGMTTSRISDLIAGTYVVTATDAIGCIVSEAIMVTQPVSLQPNMIGTNGQCGINGSAAVSPQGGFAPYTYLWSTGEVSNAVSNLTPGTYSVEITDGTGCTVSASTSIAVDPNFVSFEINKNNITCAGEEDGMIDVTVLSGTAPYSFMWNNGMTTEDVSGLTVGSYMLTITDANGCVAISNVLINGPEVLSVELSTINVTNGDNGLVMANVIGGTNPYTFMWSNNVTDQINKDLSPGTFSVTITDANGCTAVESTIVQDITGVETIESLTDLTVYPNPTRSMINIEATFTTFEAVEIHLMNIVGQTVWNKNVEGNTLTETIDVTSYPTGTYLLKLRTESGQVIEKIAIVK